MSQIALPLTLRANSDPDRIVIGNANHAVYEALQNPQDWPFNTAVLKGHERSGKSQLGKWEQSQGITVFDGADKEDETEILHHWKAAKEGGDA